MIGCEFASLYQALGVEVTVVEMLPNLVATEAPNVCNTLERAFKRKGIKIHTSTTVDSVKNTGKKVEVTLVDKDSISAEMALIAVGRSLNTTDIGLDKAGLATENDGSIPVNEKMETEVKGIYAIGDITGTYQLAHVASHQGLVAAGCVAGFPMQMHYNAVPSVIFTQPEIASVGMTLEQAIEAGHNATLGAFPFAALGKAQRGSANRWLCPNCCRQKEWAVVGSSGGGS